MPGTTPARARLRFRSRNYAFFAAGMISLAVGYWLLARGSTELAPLLLVLGYCVCIPVGLAL